MQAPNYTQSYNRYSYVWNNPMKYTDPSGYQVRQQDAYNWTNPWDVFIHGSGPWMPFKAEGSGPRANPVTQGGRFMPSVQVGPTYGQIMNLRFWSNVTSTLMMNGSGYVITSFNAFGKTNFVGSFGPLGNMNIWGNGAITFENKTAAMHLLSAWVFSDASGGEGFIGTPNFTPVNSDYSNTAKYASFGAGLGAGIVGESARGFTTTTSAVAREIQAAKVIGKIATAAKWTGYLGNFVSGTANVINVYNDPSAANYARAAVSGFAMGLNLVNFVVPGLGTGLSIGVSAIDMAGGFNWLYNGLETDKVK